MNNNEKTNKLNTTRIASIILLVIVVFGLIAISQNFHRLTGYLVVVSGIIGCASLRSAIKNFSITRVVLASFYLVETSVEYIFAIYDPRMIIVSNYNKYYDAWLFDDNFIVLKYFLCATLFLAISFICSHIIDHVKLEIKSGNNTMTGFSLERVKERKYLFPYPLFFLIVVSLIDCLIRIRGMSLSYIGYVLSGTELFFFMGITIVVAKRGFNVKSVIQLLLGFLFFSLPGMLVGRRVFVMRAGFDALLFFLLMIPDTIAFFVKKRKVFVGIMIAALFCIFGLANYRKFGVFNPIGAFVHRLIGLFDGCSVLKYLESNKMNMDFENFLKCAINNSGTRANWYYTYRIVGFPLEVSNGFAAPIFIISLLYGYLGMVVISAFYCLIFSVAGKKAQRLSYVCRQTDNYDAYKMAYIFISCDLMVFILQKYFLDGNVEIIKDFSTSIVALLFVRLTSLIVRKR